MTQPNMDYQNDTDHLLGAKQLMNQYWNREHFGDDPAADTQLRIAELLAVLAEASVSIAESLYQLSEPPRRARK